MCAETRFGVDEARLAVGTEVAVTNRRQCDRRSQCWAASVAVAISDQSLFTVVAQGRQANLTATGAAEPAGAGILD